MRICKTMFLVLAFFVCLHGWGADKEERPSDRLPFRVCGLVGTPDKPWVGVVWRDSEEALLLRPGQSTRGYTLKQVDIVTGRVFFERDGSEFACEVEEDPAFAAKNMASPIEPEPARIVTAEEFLNRYPVVVLADGTRLERPAGGWRNEPVTFEEFLKLHEGEVGAGLTAAEDEWAARMAEAAAESQKAAQQLQTPEDLEKARYEGLKQMAAEVGMEPPSPEDLKPVTYDDFLRMHGDAATNALKPAAQP